MAQAGYTPISLYYSTTASTAPTSGNLVNGELAINITDGKLYYKDNGGTVQIIASKAGASGDVVGPASATDNAIVRFDGTTGKLVQNSVVTIADSTGDISGVGQLNATTLDATNIEVTNIKAKDGTAAASIADSTGVVSITANPVLSGGTANGVLYLNGSKVATSGSALTFNGTSFGVPNIDLNNGGTQYFYSSGFGSYFALTNNTNALTFGYNGSEQMRLTSTGLGIGTSSPGAKLHTQSAIGGTQGIFECTSGSSYLQVKSNNSAAVDAALMFTDGTNTSYFGAMRGSSGGVTGALQAYTGGAIRLTLDSSGNLGIGTSSPSSKLQVNGNFRVEGATSEILMATGAERTISASGSASSTALTFKRWNGSSYVNDVVMDGSGNLGLGVTPSGGTYPALEFGSPGIICSNGDMNIASNAYYNAGWKYKNNGVATLFLQTTGQNQWFTAASGTANNTISWTQALTLDASGNLLLGGTSAGASSAASLAIFNGTAPTGSVTNGIILYAQDVSSSSELKVRDEAGNVTTLSPHNFSLIPDGPSEDMAWAYYSEKGGKRINVDMLKLARMVEKLTGEKLVYES